MEDNKYVEWFIETVRSFEDSIIAQKAYLEHLNFKPERLILGKRVYEMLNHAFDLQNGKNNVFKDLQIAIDCNDDYLIAVCHGSKADANSLIKEIEE